MKRFLNSAYVLFLAGVACFFMRSPVFAVTPTPYPRVTGGTITVDAALTTGANTITGLKFIDNADANYYLDPSGAISLVVDGTVGIGTTEPAYLLDVYTNTAAEEGIGIKNANSGGGATLVLRTNAIGTVMGLIANGSAYTTYGGANSLNIYQGNNAPIAFLTNGNSTPRMVISGAGLVGIGTTGPLFPLHVIGTGGAVVMPEIYSGADGTALAWFPVSTRAARGTLALPSALQANDVIFGMGARGYTGSAFTTGAKVAVVGYAAETWSSTANGTYITFNTTDKTTTTLDERIRITDAGLVGIGTTGPGAKLTVQTSGTTDILNLFETGGTEVFTVLESGSVGIGTTSPATILNIVKDQDADTSLVVDNASTGTAAFSQLGLDNQRSGDSRAHLYLFGTAYTTAGRYIQDGALLESGSNLAGGLGLSAANASGNIYFYTAGNSERMRITSAGRVGIGTTNPGYELDVVGTVYASGSSRDYKEHITDLVVDTENLYRLRPVSFDYKPEYIHLGKVLGNGHQIGLIAEEVYQTIPELAIYNNGEIRNVDYEKLSILLLAELKKHKQAIERLNQQIDLLDAKIEKLVQ